MTSLWYSRILALLLAVLSWYLVTGRERVDSWVRVRVEMSGLADGLVLLGAPRDHLDVLVRGPKGLVRTVDPAELVYTLDASKLVPGRNTVVVGPDAVALSRLFEVVEIRPANLEFFVERRVTRTVPVLGAFKDASARDYTIVSQLDPPQVTLSGPESVLQDVDEVLVEPMALPDAPSGSFETFARLVLPDQVEASPRTVKAKVQFRQNMREAVAEAPVRVAYQGPASIRVASENVTLRLRVPVPLLREGGWRGLVDAYVEVPPSTPPGRHEYAYKVTLPQGCELIQAKPERISVFVK